MTRPPLTAPLLGRCPHAGCRRPFKATIDLRARQPTTNTTCPWCHQPCTLTLPD